MSAKLDLIVIGAGPAGLACGIQAKKSNLDFLILEKGCIVNSVYNYPVDMTFFTTADLLEIGDIPMIISSEKPKRMDGLRYYRRVVDYFGLPVRDYERVVSVEGERGNFRVRSVNRLGEAEERQCGRIILATGYYDNPNLLGIPGEDLSKVRHYYSDCHPYHKKKVAVIGGNNSAAEAALDLFRNGGAEVTLIHRGKTMGKEIKYWVLPDINNRISRGEIKAYFSSRVEQINETTIRLSTLEGEETIPNDFVLAMTGYHPDVDFLRAMQIEVEEGSLTPKHDPETLETNVSGIYLAGSIVAGRMTNRVFIENGRFHGKQIFRHWDVHKKGSPRGSE